MIHEHGDIVMVKIPEANRQIHEYVLNSIPEAGLSWLHFLDVNGDDCARQEEFIGNNYTLIGKGNELSEDEWRGIGYNTESGLSLLKSKGMKGVTTLILKKVKS